MLHFKDNEVHQPDPWGNTKVWTMAELLENHAPLSGEPTAVRLDALQKAVAWAKENPTDLSETALLHLDFWTNFRPKKISEQTFVFKRHDGDTAYQELTLNESGLFYHDRTDEAYASAPEPVGQLFSEFWFYGPRHPIPDLVLRKRLIERIKHTFANPNCPSATAHFELFEYPKKSLAGLSWTEGNHVRTDFINVSTIGIEMGYWTFRDPPGKPGLLSFENFLHHPPQALLWISPEIRAKIEAYLEKKSKSSPPAPLQTEPKILTPREKMELAEALLQDPNSEEGADALIALLVYETESDYWRNYVFNRMFKLRDNNRVQHFVLECLEDNNEIWFKKAADVLSAWGFFYGDTLLADRNLLLRLNWGDATANDPDFRNALEKAKKIVLKTP